MLLSDMVCIGFRTIRKRRGLTQAELADRMGTTNRTISQIETGAQVPSLETVENFLMAVELTPEEFFSFDLKGKSDAVRVKHMTEINDITRTLSNDGLGLAASILRVMEDHERKPAPKKRPRK